MKIIKLGRGISATIESKKSQAGKEYEQASICKSSKTQTGEYKKEYLNIFPNDIPELIAILESAYSEYITERTKEILESGKAKPEVKEEPKQDDFSDDSIPFN